MKNDTTFVRMRSGDRLGYAKMSKKGTSLRFTFFFINCDRNCFRRMKEKGQIYKMLPQIFFILAKGFSYDHSKFSDDFTAFFWLWKTITKSLGKN